MAFFLSPHEGGGSLYLVPPLAGVPGAVEPEFETEALASGVGVGLVPLLVEGVEGVEEVEGLELDGVEEVAPVSSTFFPQAPSANRAARARAVAAAGFNLDACMCVSLYVEIKVNLSIGGSWLSASQPPI